MCPVEGDAFRCEDDDDDDDVISIVAVTVTVTVTVAPSKGSHVLDDLESTVP